MIVNGDHRKRKRSPSMTVLEHRDKRVSLSRSKETVEQIQFREFVGHVHAILSSYTLFTVTHSVAIRTQV